MALMTYGQGSSAKPPSRTGLIGVSLSQVGADPRQQATAPTSSPEAQAPPPPEAQAPPPSVNQSPGVTDQSTGWTPSTYDQRFGRNQHAVKGISTGAEHSGQGWDALYSSPEYQRVRRGWMPDGSAISSNSKERYAALYSKFGVNPNDPERSAAAQRYINAAKPIGQYDPVGEGFRNDGSGMRADEAWQAEHFSKGNNPYKGTFGKKKTGEVPPVPSDIHVKPEGVTFEPVTEPGKTPNTSLVPKGSTRQTWWKGLADEAKRYVATAIEQSEPRWARKGFMSEWAGGLLDPSTSLDVDVLVHEAASWWAERNK